MLSWRRFSRTKASKLTKWIRELLTEYGEHFCLIIADHTHLETPWEMVELNDDEYLGAKAVALVKKGAIGEALISCRLFSERYGDPINLSIVPTETALTPTKNQNYSHERLIPACPLLWNLQEALEDLEDLLTVQPQNALIPPLQQQIRARM